MTDEELLARFDGHDDFREGRAEWTDEQSTAFCRMARAAHDAGLDWYHVPNYAARFGRKEPGKSATATLGSANAGEGFVSYHQKRTHRAGIEGRFTFDDAGADAFAQSLDDFAEPIASLTGTTPNDRQTLWPHDYENEANDMPETETKPDPQNRILYGPPGTGKTYHTTHEAVRLCGEEPSADRGALKAQYERLRDEKRIAFVTFHQSYDYEAFVEGLRPQTAQEGAGFSLEPKPGIFREICSLAEQAINRPSSHASDAFDFDNRRFWKMGQGAIGTEDEVYEDAIAGNHIALGYGGAVDWSNDRFDDFETIKSHWLETNPDDPRPSNWTQIWPFRSEMKPGDLVIVPYGNTAFRAIGEVTGDYRYDPSSEGYYGHRRDVRWLLELDEPLPLDTIVEGNFTMRTLYSIAPKRVNFAALSRLIGSMEETDRVSAYTNTPDQFVLIIDEINRANISKVFGELITLIEPDKRIGMDEELRVQLPYSRKAFGVPANLHIVGTMNTADRSIMQLDTALRRRFRFKEMAPDTSVPAFLQAERATGLKLGKILDTINERIEYLLDRDHCIGHSFFIGCESEADVDREMEFKIIPLLQEYFFEDWSRIHAVLGGGFVESRTLKAPPGLDDQYTVEERRSWSIRETFADDAYETLLSQSVAQSARNAEDDGDGASGGA